MEKTAAVVKAGRGPTRDGSIFDRVVDRRHSDSVKWACGAKLLAPDEFAADPLPMWVADMDFRAPLPVIDKLREVVEQGMFGYPDVRQSYIDAVVGWEGKRFGWDISGDWIVQSPGVVTALRVAIQAFSAPGDAVLIQPPVYIHFHTDPVLNGRRLASAPLLRVDDGYRFDAATFEAAITDDTKLFILCNPHNPTGNVWSEDELRTMGEICARHNILVVSDEIHQDLIINPAKKHHPFASLGEAFAQNSIICTSPSKTFNLAGLRSANLIIPNRRIRDEFERQVERNMAPGVNTLGMVAAEAAYLYGELWLEELLIYLRDNHRHFAEAINGALPKVRVLPADALYLAWMDCRGLGMDPDALDKFMLTKARLWLDKGQKFGPEGHGYMRVNLGCPRVTVDEAIKRLVQAVSALS
ncbi:MalY/PatB family protein [Pleomorphomonas sp. PLEO]|uniref:MalY/PatB family protein n=1 Tax=Pleomorphomonas sp. PLEO TaxID=3239306 RepID=UPI00351EC0CD